MPTNLDIFAEPSLPRGYNARLGNTIEEEPSIVLCPSCARFFFPYHIDPVSGHCNLCTGTVYCASCAVQFVVPVPFLSMPLDQAIRAYSKQYCRACRWHWAMYSDR